VSGPQRARLSGDRIAVVSGGGSWTYREFEDRTNRLANQLRDRFGVRRGDRIAAVIPTSVECLEILFAASKLGAIFSSINVRFAAPEISYLLADLGAEVLFVHEAFAQARAAVDEPGVRVRKVIALGDEYDNLLATADPKPMTAMAERHDVAVIMYTSGTTGRPKGAMITHENLRANAVAVTSAFGLRSSDVTVTALPMFHIGGLGLYTLPLIYLGGRNVIMPSFDPVAVLNAVVAERATQLLLVPTMWQAIMNVPDPERYDLSSLDCALTSGAPAPVSVWTSLRAVASVPGGIRDDGVRAVHSTARLEYVRERLDRSDDRCSASTCDWSTIWTETCPSVRSAKCSCAATTYSSGTGCVRTRPLRRSATAGSTPAIWVAPTRRASSLSSTGKRTCSSAVARTSTPEKWR
jgi:acyl-CoA synthetase (AMP-forming)/AMP-acid ligase II